jgi:tRNA pseudouridine55 synthase
VNGVIVPAVNGVVVVDKPTDWTSHDVVAKFRGIARTRSVGHLGTLDPIATGVLPLIIGNATRLARFFTKATKAYDATIRFGFATDTYDRAGAPTSPAAAAPSLEAIQEVLPQFLGPIEQMPPQYSAKKVGGIAAYASSRRNVAVELQPIHIEIFELRVDAYNAPDLQLHVRCSSGTYIRSLAHDLGNLLGSGAHLQELRRTISGDFTIAQAHALPDLQQLSNENRLQEALLPAADLLPDFPQVFVDVETEGYIRQGRDFHVTPFRQHPEAQFVKVMTRDNQLLAIGEATIPNMYHPLLVLVN